MKFLEREKSSDLIMSSQKALEIWREVFDSFKSNFLQKKLKVARLNPDGSFQTIELANHQIPGGVWEETFPNVLYQLGIDERDLSAVEELLRKGRKKRGCVDAPHGNFFLRSEIKPFDGREYKVIQRTLVKDNRVRIRTPSPQRSLPVVKFNL